ncbi:MAG: hypothetical protein S4CHLAM123_02460 [Chlamydiales bacterium]|nr:hypothetical protein [Chlamydiales bacterium]
MGDTFHCIFRPIGKADRNLVHSWLDKSYIKEWFYGDGLANTLKGIDEFIEGVSDTKYWLAYDKNRPFAFLITSLVKKPEDELSKWCVAKGTTITLDMLIGEEDYLGKKLSHVVIKEFLLSEFPEVEEVLIDPEASNSRAVHVYEKVGFKILGEFIPSHSPHLHYMMRLDMKQLSQNLNIRSETQQQLKETLELLKMILGPDLLGVYLFGSSLVGGLQKYSDIDLFVVTNRVTTPEEKTRFVANLLQISGIYMKSSKLPIEMTLVEKAAIDPWQYPPHFDFQYGEWLRQSFEIGIIEPWSTYEMPDLALIVTQVLLKSKTLWGSEPQQLLAHVPYPDFMKAMLHDLGRLSLELEDDTRNVLLTYARIWSTLETNAIRSKPAAADWVINRLPKEYQPVMKRAKSICIGVENEHWKDIEKLIKPCADFIVEKIHSHISLVNFDDSNKLKLAEEPFTGDPSLRSG